MVREARVAMPEEQMAARQAQVAALEAKVALPEAKVAREVQTVALEGTAAVLVRCTTHTQSTPPERHRLRRTRHYSAQKHMSCSRQNPNRSPLARRRRPLSVALALRHA